MRCLKMMVAASMVAGLSVISSHAMSTIGVGAQSGALYNDNYHLGYGVAGAVGGTNGMSELDLKGNYLNYQSMGGPGNQDHSALNEGGLGITALVGPSAAFVQPKVGGHVGYTRFESTNFLDVGPDVSALFKLTPKVGIQAAVTPTWLINGSGNDYRTRASVGVQWTPGA